MKSPSGNARQDAELVDNLRSLVAAHADPMQVLAAIHVEIGESSWISDSFYLRVAFNLSLEEVSELLGWRRYGGPLSDAECGRRLTELIERHRHEWGRSERS